MAKRNNAARQARLRKRWQAAAKFKPTRQTPADEDAAPKGGEWRKHAQGPPTGELSNSGFIKRGFA